VADIVEKHGKLIVGDKGELMVECRDEKIAKVLSDELNKNFKDQVLLAP
jgi:hypothetical protein